MTKLSVPLGYRFYPLDFELIECLKRRLKGEQSEGIANVNIYEFDPWDLPAKSCSKTKDLAWYFFCIREKKYPNGDRIKRDTKSGFWKTTGNDRTIPHKGKTVGMVKTLIFHTGQAPSGARTDWFMHEYRLKDQGNFIMASPFKPGNICIGSSSESTPFKSVQPTENISRPVVGEYISIYEGPSYSLDELDSPPVASAHDNYGRENLYDGDYEGFLNGNQLCEYGMSLSDLPPEKETQNMAEDFQTYANPQELGTLSKKRKYTGCIEDAFQNSLQEND